MIKIPFEKSTFAREMKPKISGNNLTLEFDNLQSTLAKIAVEFYDFFSKNLYEKIVEKTAAEGEHSAELNAHALDYLQRSMLHFALYQHVIYLIANIGNDGITVKKSDDKTTIFKYQQDQLENKLISDAWFWLNRLIAFLNENAENFPDWQNSEQKKQADELPVAISDFKKWVGISDDAFMLFARWIIREVWEECVLSRISADKIEEIKDNAMRPLCYEVVARVCKRLAYYCLPEPIRLDINNEMGKNHNAQADTYIREKVAEIFEQKAQSYWIALDAKIEQKKDELAKENISEQQFKPSKITENHSFAF
ncbi:MAG: hypothetical protein LBS50_08560 [Prevotellaceae bacterium]|jgi:hypothetical protein|nr:hypothetical protein [Prevotellaceae bacterium]